jgi:hypothetical protein
MAGKAADYKSLEMIFLKVDPRFDRVHDDTRLVKPASAHGTNGVRFAA